MKKNEIKRTAKAFNMLAMAIDEEQKKLSDKMKHIELSHNRKIGLLKKLDFYLKMQEEEHGFLTKYPSTIKDLRNEINKELTFCGRINWGN